MLFRRKKNLILSGIKECTKPLRFRMSVKILKLKLSEECVFRGMNRL